MATVGSSLSMHRRIGSFPVRDSSGKQYIVNVWQELIDVSRGGDGNGPHMRGLKSMTIEAGEDVTQNVWTTEDGRLFAIIGADEVELFIDHPQPSPSS